MKILSIFLALFLLVSSCTNSGYNPSYIISDTATDHKEVRDEN